MKTLETLSYILIGGIALDVLIHIGFIVYNKIILEKKNKGEKENGR